MKVVVCVKHVGSLADEVGFVDDDTRVDPHLLDYALNEWDLYATEEALLIRERLGGEVVAVTIGDEEAETALRRCLAMGVDRAVRVDGDDDADPLVVARTLAAVIGKEQADLVLCGVQSSDAAQGATGTMLAELLGLPRVMVVRKLEIAAAGQPATVERELEGGLVDVVEVDTPALLGIQTGINAPRYAPLRAIRQAADHPIEIVDPEPEGDRAFRVRKLFAPAKPEGPTMIEGSASDIAQRIAEIVKERAA